VGVFFLFLVLIWCDPHPIGRYCALIQKDKQFHNSPLSLSYMFPLSFSICTAVRASGGVRIYQAEGITSPKCSSFDCHI